LKKTALIIEDEKNIAEAQALILGELYDIHHAFDGDEGLKKAEDLKPHVIILDLMLPKRNGYDVCFNIRQNKELNDTKIVMVTAKNQKLDVDKGNFIGADKYITKPFDPDDLLNAVSEVLK
tara:strand:- start:7638 stop:8000 length:363 start_codon:yes stop_codon:yes gene_type:complete